MFKVAILGATGYTALELLKLLRRHPFVEVVAVTSRENTNPIAVVHPSLTGQYDVNCENLKPTDLAERGGVQLSSPYRDGRCCSRTA